MTKNSKVVALQKALQRRWLIASLAALSITAYFLVFSKRGVVERYSLQRRKNSVVEEISRLKKQEDSLRTYIQVLEKDTFMVEKIARERYGMIKQNEKVYIVEDDN